LCRPAISQPISVSALFFILILGGIKMNKYGIVLTTFENHQQAPPVIDEILRCRLAACVQEIRIKSHYRWKGEICHEDEVLVLLKTRKELYPELEKKLLEIHPYDTPEILSVDVDKGSAAYLKWIDEQTSGD
jgi:periplasmic divalent cation tolerance protein